VHGLLRHVTLPVRRNSVSAVDAPAAREAFVDIVKFADKYLGE